MGLQKLTISAPPMTNIYSPKGTQLAIADAQGIATVKLSPKSYYAYLLSQDPNSNLLVPFGLNYKNKNYEKSYVLKGALYGGVPTVVATIGMGVGIGMPPLGLAGLIPVPLYMTLAWVCTPDNPLTNNQIKYLPNQVVNSQFQFTMPDIQYVNWTANAPE